MSSTTKARKPRSLRLVLAPTATMPGLLEMTIGKETTTYFLGIVSADVGRAFLLEKMDPVDSEKYQVRLGPEPSCGCKGFRRWGHCKHLDALAALVKAGRL